MSGEGHETEIFDRIGDLEIAQARHDERIEDMEELLKEIHQDLKKIQRTLWQYSGAIAIAVVLADFLFHNK